MAEYEVQIVFRYQASDDDESDLMLDRLTDAAENAGFEFGSYAAKRTEPDVV
jgi:hypothetical protein